MALLNWLLGKPLASEEDSEQRGGVLTGVPSFGLDALGSAAYGPEAALTLLIPAAAAGIAYVMPISLTIMALLLIVFFSYRQTIDAYPHGGGSYTVASQNLGRNVGLLAGAALMLDYLLDVGVGISTGVGALVSAVPKLQPHTLALCLAILVAITIISLRGITVLIVLVAKFIEGAWITVLAVPLIILLMKAVNRHYGRVAAATRIKQIDIVPLEPPVAVVPVSNWNKSSQAALQFACSLTSDVKVLHVNCPDEVNEHTVEGWQLQLNAAADAHGKPRPSVIGIPSPFRFITSPVVNAVVHMQGEFPHRRIALVLPDLIATHWYHYLLHNHRAMAIRGMLLMRGVSNVAIINVPWYLPQ